MTMAHKNHHAAPLDCITLDRTPAEHSRTIIRAGGLQAIARVIPFVGHEVAGIFRRRCGTHSGKVPLRLFRCVAERRRVASLRLRLTSIRHASKVSNAQIAVMGDWAKSTRAVTFDPTSTTLMHLYQDSLIRTCRPSRAFRWT